MICESINTRDVVSPPVVGVSTWLGADQTLDQQSGEIHGIEGKHCLSWASPRLPGDVTTMNAAANNSASVMIHLPVFLVITFDFFSLLCINVNQSDSRFIFCPDHRRGSQWVEPGHPPPVAVGEWPSPPIPAHSSSVKLWPLRRADMHWELREMWRDLNTER